MAVLSYQEIPKFIQHQYLEAEIEQAEQWSPDTITITTRDKVRRYRQINKVWQLEVVRDRKGKILQHRKVISSEKV